MGILTDPTGNTQLDGNNLPIEGGSSDLRLSPTPRANVPSFATSVNRIDTGFDVDYNSLNRDINPHHNIEAQLEQAQSGWQMWRNASAQALAEVGLGTLEGVSYLVNMEQMGGIAQNTEKEFTNWFAELMKEGKEAVQEAAPVYRSLEAQEGFAPMDATWWASNASSLASTLSLIIPAAGVVRGASLLGRGARALGIANKVFKTKSAINTAKGITGALASRYMENTMEAAEVYEQSYGDLIAKGMSDEEASIAAGKAASNVWKANNINLMFDIMQYTTLTKGINISNFASKEFRKGMLGQSKEIIGQIVNESAEEGIQYLTSKEAQDAAITGRDFTDLTGFTTRMGDYLQDPELYSALMLGAVGGGIFTAGGKAFNKIAGVDKKIEASLAKIRSLDQGDITSAHKIHGAILLQEVYEHAKAGKVNDLKNFYQEIANTSDEDLLAAEMTQEEIDEKRKKDKEILEDIDYLAKEYVRIFDDANLSKDDKEIEFSTIYEKRSLARANSEIVARYEELKSKVVDKKEISSNEFALLTNKNKLIAYEGYLENYNNLKGDRKGSEKVIKKIEKRIAQLKEQIKLNEKAVREENGLEENETFDIPTTSEHAEIVMTLGDEVSNDVNQMETDRKMKNMSSKEGREDLRKEKQELRTKQVVDSITDDTSLSNLNQVSAEEGDVGKAARAKVKKLADDAEKTAPVPSGENFDEQVDTRYASKPLLKRDLDKLREEGAPESAIDKIKDAETFKNVYSNNAAFKQTVDKFFGEKLANIEEEQRDPQEAPKEEEMENNSSDERTDGEQPTKVDSRSEFHSIVQTNENVWYTYDPLTGIIKIKGLRGKGRTSIDTIGDAYLPVKPGGPHILYNSDGTPVENDMNVIQLTNGKTVPFMSKEDFEFLNDPNNDLYDKEIELSILFDSTFSPANEGITADNMLVTVHYMDGDERRTLGMLRSTAVQENTESYQQLKALRQELYNEWKASDDVSGLWTSDKKITIADRTPGKHNYGTNKQQAPHEVMGDEKLLFGIVDTNKDTGAVEIRLTKGDNSHILEDYGIRVKQQLRWNPDSELKNMKGAVVMFIRMADGTYSPTKLYTQNLGQLPLEQQKVREYIEAAQEKIENGEDVTKIMRDLNRVLQKRVYVQLVFDTNSKMFKLEKRNSEGDIVQSEGMNVDGIMESLENTPMRVNLNEINSGSYNKTISERGWVKTDISPARKVQGSNIKLALDAPIQSTETISDNVYNEFVDNGNVSQELLNDLAEKVKLNQSLTPREAAIFADKTGEINDIIAKQAASNLASGTPTIDFGNTRSNTRAREVDTSIPYEKWDRKKEEAWFKTNFPNVPLNVLSDLNSIAEKGGVDLWGMFKNGAVYIDSAAAKGTAYHEAFHALFHIVLNDKERASIIEAGEQFAKGEEAVEEYWADKFMEYMLTEGQVVPEGVKANVAAFFKRLWHLINIALERTGIKGPATMEDYFYRASKGLYRPFKTPTFTRNVTRFRKTERNSSAQLSRREEPLGVGIINSNLVQTVLPMYRKHMETLDSNAKSWDDQTLIKNIINYGLRTKNEQFSINGMYRAVAVVLSNEAAEATDERIKSELQRTVNSLIVDVSDDGMSVKFGPLLTKAVNSLWYMGVKVSYLRNDVKKSKDQISEDQEFELNEEVDGLENWKVKEKFLSAKEKFSQKAKALMALVPSDKTFGGLIVYDKASHVYNTLSGALSDSTSVDDMMLKLKDVLTLHPNYKIIYDRLLEDNQLRSEFWINMGQRHLVEFVMQEKFRNGEANTFSSNRRKASEDVLTNWQYNVYSSEMYDNTERRISIPNADKYMETLNALVRAYEIKLAKRPNIHVEASDVSRLHTILKGLQLPVTRKQMTRMFGKPFSDSTGGAERLLKFIGSKNERGLIDVIRTMSKGNDPFIASDDQDTRSAVRNMSQVIADATPDMYQRMFMSAKKKKIYAILQSRFIFKHLLQMKQTGNPDATRRRNALFERYANDPFYKDSPFLANMQDVNTRKEVRFAVFDAFREQGFSQATDYGSMTREQIEGVKMNGWFNPVPGKKAERDYGYYMLPILADSTSTAFIRYKKQSIPDIEKALIATARQERNRIKWVEKAIAEGKEIPPAMRTNGLNYQIFTFLNDKKITDFPAQVKAGMKKVVDYELKQLVKDGVLKFDPNTKQYSDNTGMLDKRFNNQLTERIEQYLYNQIYMNIQNFINFAGDPAYYKTNKKESGMMDVTDAFKRVKEIWSPGDYLAIDKNNYFITDKGEKIGINDDYKVTYWTDPSDQEKLVTEHGEMIEKIFPGKENEWIRELYGLKENSKKGLNNTDAATWIDIVRLREIYIGTGRWTTAHQEIYDKVMNGEPVPSNAAIVLQPSKPFLFTHREVDGRIIPTQHKNAEFLLTPDMAEGNPEIQKILEKMGYQFDKNGKYIANSYNEGRRMTDAVMFTSAVKVGNFNAVNSMDELTSDKVHIMKNTDYRIQMATPEHHIDSNVLFGTQIRKLIVEGMNMRKDYTVPGMDKPIKGAVLFQMYQEAISKNIKESYEELENMFKDEEGNVDQTKMLDALRNEAIEQEMDDIVEALQPKGDGTLLPLWHPHIAYRVEALLNSFFKNNVTKQKSNGAALYNAPSFGLSPEQKPRIIFDEKTRAIKYFEVIMPIQSKRMVDRYADSNGIIDPNKVPEELKKGIFYRIPTEGKYSMFHVKVKSYLPSYAGGQIIMPDEATTIAGLDFDIDKVYGLMYNITKADGKLLPDKFNEWYTWINTPTYSPKAGEKIIRAHIEDFDAERSRKEFAKKENIEWDAEANSFREKSALMKVPSSMDTREGRDNMIIDLMWGVLSHPDTASKQLKPGGFRTLTEAKKLVLDLENRSEAAGLNIMSANTQREIFERNMTGNNLIGIFANHNANHAIMQFGKFNFRYAIDFNGNARENLSAEKDVNGNSISENIAEFLAAAVDNAKEPLASFLNITTTTADAIAAMLRVGHDPKAVMMYMASPAMKEFSKRLSRENNTGKRNIKKVIETMKNDVTKNVANKDTAAFFEKVKELDLIYKDGKGNIKDAYDTIGKQLKDYTPEELMTRWKMLDTLQKVLENAEALSIVQAGMRYDSINNAAGPTVAHTEHRRRLYENAKRNELVTGFTKFIKDNKIPYVNEFYQYGINNAKKDIFKITKMPYARNTEYDSKGNVTYSNIFNDVVSLFEKYGQDRITPEEIDSVYRQIMTMMATAYPTFSRNEMQRVLRELPKRLSVYNRENPENDYGDFLSHFITEPKKGSNPFATLRFNRQGIDEIQKKDLREAWGMMLNSEITEEREIARDLVKYSFFMTGYGFGTNTFSDLVPMDYISELYEEGAKKKYEDYISDAFFYEYTPTEIMGFVDQIVKNNFQGFNFIPMMDARRDDSIKVSRDADTGMLSITVNPKYHSLTLGLKHPVYGKMKKNQYVEYVKMPVQAGIDSTRMVLMKTNGIYNEEDGTITYNEIEPLGLNNVFYEYSLANMLKGKPVESLFKQERELLGLKSEDYAKRAVPTDPNEIAEELANVLEGTKGKTASEKFGNLAQKRDYVAKLLKTSNIYSLNEFKVKAEEVASETGNKDLAQYDFTVHTVSEAEKRKNDCDSEMTL